MTLRAVCEICGKTFVAKTRAARTCGQSCRSRRFRESSDKYAVQLEKRRNKYAAMTVDERRTYSAWEGGYERKKTKLQDWRVQACAICGDRSPTVREALGYRHLPESKLMTPRAYRLCSSHLKSYGTFIHHRQLWEASVDDTFALWLCARALSAEGRSRKVMFDTASDAVRRVADGRRKVTD